MACRKAHRAINMTNEFITDVSEITKTDVPKTVERLLFGVDSGRQSNNLLQNNIDQFEWVLRNKIYPNFYGRNISGENALTKEEIRFIHRKGCRIAAIYADSAEKMTKDEGDVAAKRAIERASELEIPADTAIFIEIAENENASSDFILGFSRALISGGFTPGFKANTDARFSFDREFSRAKQTDKDILNKCLVWATSPSLAEYDRVTTTHLIHPDNWIPHAPSGITRKDIAIWQYGKNCHPIEDDQGRETTFNLNLVRNEQVIIDKMF